MFFLFIFIIVFLIIAVHTMKLGIQIQNLRINTESSEKINKEYQINVILSVFSKIKIFNKDIRKMKDQTKKLEDEFF